VERERYEIETYRGGLHVEIDEPDCASHCNAVGGNGLRSNPPTDLNAGIRPYDPATPPFTVSIH